MISYELSSLLTQRIRVRDGILYLSENMGITTFYAGGALGFDSLAAEAVIEQKKTNPWLQLVIVVPCRCTDRLVLS